MIRYRRTGPAPLNVARRQHAVIDNRIGSPDYPSVGKVSPAVAAALYAGITGLGPTDAPLASVVQRSTPDRFAALVRLDAIAAAYAAACQMESFSTGTDGAPARADRAWLAFRELADHADTLVTGLGGDASAAWPIIDKTRRIPTARPDQLRKIVALAGRLLAALRGAAQRRGAPIPEEITGIETGEDVPALMPEEFALLGLPPTEMEAFRRIAERQAQQLERRGREKKTRGPLVLAVDESYSMTTKPHRMIWSKAVAVAMTRLAWEGKRTVVWLAWSTSPHSTILKPGDAVGLAECVARMQGGGTDTPRALDLGTEEIRTLEREGQHGADLVLISDGETDPDVAGLLPGAVDRLLRTGARLWSIAIELEFEGPLRDRAALYLPITAEDMENPNAVRGLSAAAKAT